MGLNDKTPVFPITVTFDDGDVWVFEDPEHIETSLEWFDSEDPDEGAVVTDASGRRVRLKVVALDIKVFELCP